MYCNENTVKSGGLLIERTFKPKFSGGGGKGCSWFFFLGGGVYLGGLTFGTLR